LGDEIATDPTYEGNQKQLSMGPKAKRLAIVTSFSFLALLAVGIQLKIGVSPRAGSSGVLSASEKNSFGGTFGGEFDC